MEVGDRVCLLDLDNRWGIVQEVTATKLIVYIEPCMIVHVFQDRVKLVPAPTNAAELVEQLLHHTKYHRLTATKDPVYIERDVLMLVKSRLKDYHL